MGVIFRVAIRNMKRRKSRYILTTVTLIIGVALFGGMLIVRDSVRVMFVKDIDNRMGTADILIRENEWQDGWFTVDERSPGIGGNGLFMLHYDKWDQTIFTKSKFRIKKLFKGFYNSRDFDPNGDDSDGAGQALIAQLSAAFKPASGQRLLPWWKKRMLRSNPFNADGALCDKKD